MQQNYIHLEWDTTFFGFGVARIVRAEMDADELSETLKFLHDNKYRLVYWQLAADQYESAKIAQIHGGFLADEKVTYVKNLVDMTDFRKASAYIPFPYPDKTPEVAMIKLALQSGEHSRFRNDSKFPLELYDKLFTCWIMRSVSKEIAWEVLLIEEGNDLLGLITLGVKGERADIGLVAVADYARGKGVGRALVADADKRFAESGYALAQVVTQRSNLGACRLYESCGYQIEIIENVFHFWL